MSLVVTVYVPSGIVMAADSRMTATRREEKKEGEEKTITKEQQVVLSDYAYKLIALDSVPVGIASFDAAIISNEPIDSHIRRFEEALGDKGDSVLDVAQKIASYFQSQFSNVPVGFHVCGYQEENKRSVPYVYSCHTIREIAPKRHNADEKGNLRYGVTWSGDRSVIERLIDRNLLPLFAAMPLQDAIDYAIYLIRTSIDTLRFEPRFPTVGGAIDVLVITPEKGPHFIQRKELHGG